MRNIAQNTCNQDYRKSVTDAFGIKKLYTPTTECIAYSDRYTAKDDSMSRTVLLFEQNQQVQNGTVMVQ
jgi:hypothetical protein